MLTPFFIFKGTTQAYLLKILITQNKNLNPLLSWLIDCISGKSTLKYCLSIKNKLFFFKFFLIIALSNSSANGRWLFASVVTPLPAEFSSKNYKPEPPKIKKKPKENICHVTFSKKAIEMISLLSIFNRANVKSSLISNELYFVTPIVT